VKVWISKHPADDGNAAAIWIELGDDRMLWIMDSGAHGIARDLERWNEHDDRLSARLSRDDGWEEL